jgi:hypothetical protein
MKHSTVLIADDHSVVVEGLRRILDHPEFEVMGVAKDGRALVQAATRLQPDVAYHYSRARKNFSIRTPPERLAASDLRLSPQAVFGKQGLQGSYARSLCL